jgi:hypothetical protein
VQETFADCQISRFESFCAETIVQHASHDGAGFGAMTSVSGHRPIDLNDTKDVHSAISVKLHRTRICWRRCR